MSKDNVVSVTAPEASETISDPLTDLLRRKANDLVRIAVEAEFEEYLAAFGEELLPDGRRRADLKNRGLEKPPKLAAGDGALGF